MYHGTDPDEYLWRTQDTERIVRALQQLLTTRESLDCISVPEIETRIEMLQYLLFERLKTAETVH